MIHKGIYNLIKKTEVTKDNAEDIYLALEGNVNFLRTAKIDSLYSKRQTKIEELSNLYKKYEIDGASALNELVDIYINETKEETPKEQYEGRNILEEMKALGFTDDDFMFWNETIFQEKLMRDTPDVFEVDYSSIGNEMFIHTSAYKLGNLLTIYHKNKELYFDLVTKLIKFFFKYGEDLSKNYRIHNWNYDPNNYYDFLCKVFCAEIERYTYDLSCPYSERPYSNQYYLNNKHANILDTFESLGFTDLKERYQKEIIGKYKHLFFK